MDAKNNSTNTDNNINFNKNDAHQSAGNENRDKKVTRGSSLLEIIFGPQVSDVINKNEELPEATLAKAIDFKIEQERTKQQYYKLANMDKCLELMKFAKGYGIPAQHLVHLVNNDLSTTAITSQGSETSRGSSISPVLKGPVPVVSSKFNFPYKFPPTETNNSESSNTVPVERRTFHRRTNSPARIGAHAVAALSDSITIKEEEPLEPESPLKKKSTPSTLHSTLNNPVSHNRNLSLPTMNKFLNPSIPTNMTSILNFDDSTTNRSNRNSPCGSKRPNLIVTTVNPNTTNQSGNSSPVNVTTPLVPTLSNNGHNLKRPVPERSLSGNNISKKIHRRTRSATVIPSFGVIDLNVIDQQASRSQNYSSSNANDNNNNNDTCSESSSTKDNNSPIKLPLYQPAKYHSNSVNRLLNDY